MTSDAVAIPHAPLTLTRTFDVPRAAVWEAWTNAELLGQWWCPDHFSNTRCEADVRAGGAIHLDMRAPDGTIYPMEGTYREIAPLERLVFATRPLGPSGEAMFEVLHTVTFSGDGGQTVLTLVAEVLWASEVAAPFLSGMEPGWAQSLGKLARLLEAPTR